MYCNDNYFNKSTNIIDRFGLNFILKNPHINGVGYGLKTINGNTTNVPSLVFMVKNKLSYSQIESYFRIPKYFNGIYTDVIELDTTNCNVPKKETPITPFVKKVRPAYIGANISNATDDTSVATLGCIVTNEVAKTKLFFLSSCHALTDFPHHKKDNVQIIQPAKKFGGTPPTKPLISSEPTDLGLPRYQYDGSLIGEIYYSDPLFCYNTKQKITEQTILNPSNFLAVLAGLNRADFQESMLTPYIKIPPSKTYTDTTYKVINDYMDEKSLLNTTSWVYTAENPTRIFANANCIKVISEVVINGKYLYFSNQVLMERTDNVENPQFTSSSVGGIFILDDGSVYEALTATELISVYINENKVLATPIKNIMRSKKFAFPSAKYKI